MSQAATPAVISSAETVKPGPVSLKDRVELGGKLVAGIAVTLYLIGLIVVNIHLSRYAYFSLSLLQARYVGAGLCALSPLFCAWFLLTYSQKRVVELEKAIRAEQRAGKARETKGAADEPVGNDSEIGRRKKTKLEKLEDEWSRRTRILKWFGHLGLIGALLYGGGAFLEWTGAALFAVTGIGTMIFVTVISFWPSALPFSQHEATGPIGFGMMTAFAFLIVSVLPDAVEKMRDHGLEGFKEWAHALESPSAKLFIIVIYFLGFARLVYPAIPAYLGGGHPQQVRLIVKPEAKNSLATSGILFPAKDASGGSSAPAHASLPGENRPPGDQTVQTQPLTLILVTAESYVVVPEHAQGAVEIRRDLVDVVVFQ
jgi:hypothetical protein